MPFRAKARNLLVAIFLLSSTARAQDSIPSFERPNGQLLRTGALSYQLRLIKRDGQATPLGTRTVVVSETMLGGVSNWLIAEARTGTVVPTLDSVVVAKGDLTPVRWVAVIGTAQLGISFTRDSAYGVLQSYQGRSSFGIGVPANVLLSASHTERLLEVLPLREGYRVSAAMLVVGGPNPVFLPTELLVEREEDADVDGRRVRAWRVALRAGAIEARYWVSREGTRVVRTEQALPDGLLVATLSP